MKQQILQRLRKISISTMGCLCGLMLLVLISACSGVTTTTNANGTTSVKITGSITAVDASKGTVTVSINGQSFTINGLSAAQVSALQSQINQVFTFQVTQNTDGTYTISTGSSPTNDQGMPNVTPGVVTETPEPTTTEPVGTAEPSSTPEAGNIGSISFIGKVQSITASSIVVSVPDGSTLTANIVAGTTDTGDFNGAQPTAGQLISVEANANTDGSYTATKLKSADNTDATEQSTVTYQGITTSAVGSDNVLHFKVGTKSYSFAIGTGADLGDFNNSAASIPNSRSVKVTVTFNGTTGTVTKVSNGSN